MNAEKTLRALTKEREKFTQSDKVKMQKLVDDLVEMGEYPNDVITKLRSGMTPLTMVEGWGANWHKYTGTLNCPHCNADLRDLKTGPPFKREIAIYDMYADRTTHFQCPDCKQSIARTQ